MTKNDKSNTKKDAKSDTKGNEKVAEKLKDMGLMPSEDGVKAENKAQANETKSDHEHDQANKIPYALIVTFILFISGIMGITLMYGDDETGSGAESTTLTPAAANPNSQFNRQQKMNNLFAERRRAMQERNKAIQERNQSMMGAQSEIRNNSQAPAWVNEQRKQMQQQMEQRAVTQGRDLTKPNSEVPAWVKDRQTMVAKQHEQQLKQQEQFRLQQKEQQQKQMMAYQQWLKSQQRNQPVHINPQPVARAPAYYYPNGYNPYPPAVYYGPRY